MSNPVEIVHNPELDALRTHFADDLHMFEAQREQEFVDAINDLDSLPTYLSVISDELQLVCMGPDGQPTRTHSQYEAGIDYLEDTAIVLLENSVITYNEAGITLRPDKAMHHLETLRQIMRKTTDPEDVAGILFTIANLAAVFRPDQITETTLKKRPKESAAGKIFRTAIYILQGVDKSNRPFTDEEVDFSQRSNIHSARQDTEGWTAHLTGSSSESKHDAQIYNSILLNRFLPHKLLGVLLQSSLDTSLYKEQLAWMCRILSETVPPVQEAPKLPTGEVEWRILPPSILAALGIGIESSSYGPENSPKRPPIDDKRLRRLGQLVYDWGVNFEDPDDPLSAYLVYGRKVIRIVNGKKVDVSFRIAVLPHQLPDGTIVEDAVAETNDVTRATFAFRGEQGVDDDGTVWLTWKDVFGEDTKAALLLGARKMLHVPNHEENIEEFLTRNPKDIYRSGYRR